MSGASENSQNTRRPHSVKVPRLYKVAASILRQYRESGNGGTSLKNLVYEHQNKHPNVKAIYAILMECVRREGTIKAAMATANLFEQEPRFDRFMAEVLVAELFFGKKKLAGESRPVTTVMKYEKALKKYFDAAPSDSAEQDRTDTYPRYVRVNTLKVRTKRVLKHLKSEGFVELTYSQETTSYAEFLGMAGAAKKGEFLVDYHIPDLLLFAPKTHFYDHPLYLDGSLILQDKASCLPVVALDPPAGVVVMDACAAPGMKTTQVAAVIADGSADPEESGARVYAVERSAKRCQTLNKIVDGAGASEIVTVINSDFLELHPQDYPDVQFMVVDPSCSGSGMVNREGDSDMSIDRLQRLAALQTRLLSHALSFPGLKRVAYSTCSVSEEENEKVVGMIMQDPRIAEDFQVVNCFSSWERRGMEQFEDGRKFLRSNPEDDLCIGFFVAVIERKNKKKKKKKKKRKADAELSRNDSGCKKGKKQGD